jgi:hypothetical protein
LPVKLASSMPPPTRTAIAPKIRISKPPKGSVILVLAHGGQGQDDTVVWMEDVRRAAPGVRLHLPRAQPARAQAALGAGRDPQGVAVAERDPSPAGVAVELRFGR